MKAAARKCPVCGVAIARGKLLCLDHWRMVPRDLQRAVNRAWREFKGADLNDRDAFRMALRAYRRAAEEAENAARVAT